MKKVITSSQDFEEAKKIQRSLGRKFYVVSGRLEAEVFIY